MGFDLSTFRRSRPRSFRDNDSSYLLRYLGRYCVLRYLLYFDTSISDFAGP